MSGGGGGSGGGEWRPTSPAERSDQETLGGNGGRDGGASSNVCNITEVTTLNSLNRTTASTLRVGDVLDVELRVGPPRQLLATRSDAVAGSITSSRSAQIIQCIKRENRAYVAVVVMIRGGLCKVEIRPK